MAKAMRSSILASVMRSGTVGGERMSIKPPKRKWYKFI
jgi:hypothetical protein